MTTPIHSKRYCPVCRENHTKRQDMTFRGREVWEDRICRDCETEFRNEFELQRQVKL